MKKAQQNAQQICEWALGVDEPWYVRGFRLDEDKEEMTAEIDFRRGSRFAHPDFEGFHPVHDTLIKHWRHEKFFRCSCILEARVPRIRLPDGSVRLIRTPWQGLTGGFTMRFEASIIRACRDMSFAAAARHLRISPCLAKRTAELYAEKAGGMQDLSPLRRIAVDETSRAGGHSCAAGIAGMESRCPADVPEGRSSGALSGFADNLIRRNGNPGNIKAACIGMSPAFIRGVAERFPSAAVVFDELHVLMRASRALDETRRLERKISPGLKGMRWALLPSCRSMGEAERRAADELLRSTAAPRTVRAWRYRQDLAAILRGKQIHVVRAALKQWCTSVMRSKAEPMKEAAGMIRRHMEGIVNWARRRTASGCIEAVNGLFQAAERKARGYRRFSTVRTVIFLLAGKLDFSKINPYIPQST